MVADLTPLRARSKSTLRPHAAPPSDKPTTLPVGLRLWRISAWPGITGIGGHHSDGRWHSRPRSVLYAAEHPALAALEVMAHMRLATDNIPVTLKLIALDIAAGASISVTPQLPGGWQANEPTTQVIGNHWLDSGEALLLPVPSALLPHSRNYILNTRHAEAATHLSETLAEPFWFDKRHLR